MKVQSHLQPDSYKVRKIENDTAFVLFRENITENQTTDDEGNTETQYVYDEYELQVTNRTNLDSFIQNNLASLTAKARDKWQQELKAKCKQAVESLLDKKPQEREYKGIYSVCTYTNSGNPQWQAEGIAARDWRDAVWEKCYELLNQADQGEIEINSADDVIKELPKLVWP
jgi:hypothetical protein